MNVETRAKEPMFQLRATRQALCALWLITAVAAQAAGVGALTISTEYGRPVLSCANTPGNAYTVEVSTNLASASWKWTTTITTSAAQIRWADDPATKHTLFYRIGLATNPAPFLSLQNALRRACTNQGIVGASAAAWVPGSGLWIGTFGTYDGSIPIRPQTFFQVGSVTKTFVSATILKLVEEGRLTLEDTVGQWLPNLNWANVSASITVRQLLSHRSGIYNFGDDTPFRQALFTDWSRHWQPEDLSPYVRAPYFLPGTDGEYSNTGYVLLGMIIRSATASSVAAEMRRTILKPAGLHNTVMGAEETWNGPLANPHLDFNGDGVHEDLGALSQTAILTSFWTSGAEISTAGDLVRFARNLFEGGLLSEASLAAMRNFQSIDAGGTRLDYGLGLMRYDILGRVHWAHSGGLFGEFAWLSFCPSTGACLGVAYNHPNVKLGPNLPGELLIELSNLANTQASAAALRPSEQAPFPTATIPFLFDEVN
ncbi:MAG TPA: serine hydrolase domain-containing protein [Clostridia bacterium]|nr:serine hydrolase domain-containing protein [Clostridia bacterium]